MKIRKVSFNNKKRSFSVSTSKGVFNFPFSRAGIELDSAEKVVEAYVDQEIGREGFTFVLDNHKEGTVHIDSVLEYNKDPNYLNEILLYNLTIEVQKRIKKSDLSHREIIRLMRTSPAQFYRLLDQTNTKKHIEQMIKLLTLLDCEIDVTVRDRRKSA